MTVGAAVNRGAIEIGVNPLHQASIVMGGAAATAAVRRALAPNPSRIGRMKGLARPRTKADDERAGMCLTR